MIGINNGSCMNVARHETRIENIKGVIRQLVVPVTAIEGIDLSAQADGHGRGDISRKASAPDDLPCVPLA